MVDVANVDDVWSLTFTEIALNFDTWCDMSGNAVVKSSSVRLGYKQNRGNIALVTKPNPCLLISVCTHMSVELRGRGFDFVTSAMLHLGKHGCQDLLVKNHHVPLHFALRQHVTLRRLCTCSQREVAP